jgi:translation initiation factor 4E
VTPASTVFSALTPLSTSSAFALFALLTSPLASLYLFTWSNYSTSDIADYRTDLDTTVKYTNMADAKSSEPVPLDTIPVSPNGPMTDATNGASNGDKVVTVFDDPANFNVKHQLQHTWTLWFTKPPNGKQDWNELLKEVISFNSVEEFWGIYVSRESQRCQAVDGALQNHHPKLTKLF